MKEKYEQRTWTNDDKEGYKIGSPPKGKDPVLPNISLNLLKKKRKNK